MNNTLRNAIVGLALCTQSVANAGTIGLHTMAGLHQERAYYYSQNGDQGIDSQSRPNYGLGFETMVGDKDEKVQGLMRISWMQDAAPKSPDTGNVKSEDADIPPAYAQGPRNIGMLGLGVQWGVLGDPSGTQMNITSIVGSGFLTNDNTEFVLLELGVGGTHNLSESLQLTGTVAASMRYRKHMSLGPTMNVGVRYLFD